MTQGRIAVITGTTHGIGAVTSRELARSGYTVVMLCREFDRIALLINNAGIVSTLHRMSTDGFELTFATNHLGPFLLTQLLLDRIADDGRIVTVSSRVHYQGKLDLTRIADPKARYGSRAAYAQSKL